MTAERYTIGQFARLTRLTPTTLRHYDEVGVLVPAEVDARTGYRYYGSEQIGDGLRIAMLRSLGVPLTPLLHWRTGALSLADLLHRRRVEVHAELRRGHLAVATLDAIGAGALESEVVVEDRAPEHVPSLATITSWDRAEPATRRALARLSTAIKRSGRRPTAPKGALFPVAPCDQIVITAFHGADGRPDDGDMSTTVLPGGRVASTTIVGPYALLPLAYRSLLATVDDRATSAGPVIREDYLDEVDGLPCTRLSVAMSSVPSDGAPA